MKIHVPPIKTQGIKTKLVPWIKAVVQWNKAISIGENGQWIEPFLGSGVVGFNMMPKHAIFADSNPHIIRFYQALNDNEITPIQIQSFLETEGEKLANSGADYYYEVRERFNDHHAPLDFLFLNRSCFNGMIRFNRQGKFNVPFGHKPQRFAKAYITKIVNQAKFVYDAAHLNNWTFVCQAFQTTLSTATERDIIYCDPPYIGRHVDYYNGWDERQEEQLCKCLSDSPARFILSTWHSNQYRYNTFLDALWSNFHIRTKEHFYHIGAREDNRNTILEALILNFEPHEEEQATKPVQLRSLEEQGNYSV